MRTGSGSSPPRQLHALVAALRAPRYEVLPLAGITEEAEAVVPRQLVLTVTASPRQGLEATLTLTEQLAGIGFRAVPHLAARQIADAVHLDEIVRRMDDVGVREVFVVAGDIDRPVGRYVDSLALLTDLSRMEHGFDRIGVAGYPDGHPLVPSDVLARALIAKAPLATYLVSQLCFDHAAVSSWLTGLRAQGVVLPVHLGIAGPVGRRRLLRVASRIGVGQSARFLRKHRHALVRLATPRSYRPDRLVRRLADDLAAPEQGVAGLHVYTLNNVRATERWRLRTLERLVGVA